jgi:hypothetical protein
MRYLQAMFLCSPPFVFPLGWLATSSAAVAADGGAICRRTLGPELLLCNMQEVGFTIEFMIGFRSRPDGLTCRLRLAPTPQERAGCQTNNAESWLFIVFCRPSEVQILQNESEVRSCSKLGASEVLYRYSQLTVVSVTPLPVPGTGSC